MQKTRYTTSPEPVLIQHHGQMIQITLALHAQAVSPTTEQPCEQWEADTHQFWEEADRLDLEALRTNPEAYLHYIPHATRQAAKDRAQQLLDTLRDSCPVVPVPSFREGASVCNRPADQVKLVAGLAMGGLPYYELANGEIVNLSEADIQSIATDITAAETTWQQAKQQCWAAIDSAQSNEDISTALAGFANELSCFASSSGTTGSDTNGASWQDGLMGGWALRESWARLNSH